MSKLLPGQLGENIHRSLLEAEASLDGYKLDFEMEASASRKQLLFRTISSSKQGRLEFFMSAECQALLFDLPYSPAVSSFQEKSERDTPALRLVSREVKTKEELKAQPVELKGRLTVSF